MSQNVLIRWMWENKNNENSRVKSVKLKWFIWNNNLIRKIKMKLFIIFPLILILFMSFLNCIYFICFFFKFYTFYIFFYFKFKFLKNNEENYTAPSQLLNIRFIHPNTPLLLVVILILNIKCKIALINLTHLI